MQQMQMISRTTTPMVMIAHMGSGSLLRNPLILFLIPPKKPPPPVAVPFVGVASEALAEDGGADIGVAVGAVGSVFC